MFKVNNKNTRTMSMASPSVFLVNFKDISHLFLVFLLLTLIKEMLATLKDYSQKNSMSAKSAKIIEKDSQSLITYSKLTTETLEQGVKHVQN